MIALPLTDIETAIKARTQNLSEVHGFSHLKRTAIGARFFSKVFKTTIQEQEIAYTAGLIHDLKRPNTEKIDHSDISVREAKEFLIPYSLDKDTQDRILLLIQTHRHPQDIPLNQQWVYLSDKLLEQSGAYVIFRRSYYVGECEDFINMPVIEAFINHMKTRMNKFSPKVFNTKASRLAHYQYKWQQDFFNRVSNNQEGAVKLVKLFHQYGRQKSSELPTLIETFPPLAVEDKILKQEAIEYINGKKYSFFKKLLQDK